MSGENLTLLLDFYQQSRIKGEWASLLMETRGGKEFITFKVRNFSAGNTAGSSKPAKEDIRRKTPSQRRRDEKRKAEFIAKKSVEAKDISAVVNTNNQAILIEPKDEIVLEEPKAKEALEEENEVNLVGEYLYDTKLQKDTINGK